MAEIANSIALILKYAPDVFDDVYKKEATSSILAKNNADVQFTGAKTVRVAKRQFGRLHQYHRNNIGDERVDGTMPYGYQASAAGLTWEDHTLKMDRAAYYPIEMFDDEESGGKIVGTSITYIDKYVLVPEIDAYCWSEIYQKAGKKILNTDTLSGTPFEGFNPITKPLFSLNRAFKWEADHEVPENEQVVVCSTAFKLALQETTEFNATRFIDFESGSKDRGLAFEVARYNGREIVVVPPDRFHTEYNFEGEGFEPASGSKDIDFIVMPKNAATHIVKYEKTRILEGDVATAMTHQDGYVILTRIYHDIIVFDNRRVAIFACAGFGGSSTVNDSYNFYVNDKKQVERIIFEKGDILTLYALNLTKESGGSTVDVAAGDFVNADDIRANIVGTGTALKNGDKIAIIRRYHDPVSKANVWKVVDVASVTTAKLTAGVISGIIS